MGITIGILAHVDAGKTTLAEQILYHSGVLRSAGRVDRKNSFLDYGKVERERGITVFSDQAVFKSGGTAFYLIDTPGHVDFSGEMERSLWVMDCAILVISCVEGLQSHTETVWKLLQKHHIPTFLFLNKNDRAGANPDGLLDKIHRKWQVCCPDFSVNFKAGEMSLELAEVLAEQDSNLLELYFSEGYNREKWLSASRKMVSECRIFPVFRGSALNDEGISELLQALPLLAPEKQYRPEEPFSARVFKIRHDKQGGRVAYLKVTAGTLHPKDEILCPCPGGEPVLEKINELRCYSGSKYTPIPEAFPGEICAAVGLFSPMPGDIVGTGAEHGTPFEIRPMLSAKVIFDDSVHPKTVLKYLRELEDEEPLLNAVWEEKLQEIHVHVMGKIQLEVLSELFQERYGIDIAFGRCEILYRETIAEPVVGCGHFEPLRHYAEVHFRLEPAERGSGISFKSECSADLLAANWQNLIHTHIMEKEHKGVLTGAPLTDISVTLLAGRAHIKHTEGGDFREASYRAIRQGLMQAKSILLEPYYAFSVEADLSCAGRILSDIQRMSGTYDPPETLESSVRIRGRAPVSAMMNYSLELAAFTKGRGVLSLVFDGYEPCHNAGEVIAEKAYDPERDTANTADSVFCSHGSGYLVKWSRAPELMHIK